MSSKFTHHAQKHRLFYAICGVLLVFIVIACTANYRTMMATRKSFYTTTLERQSLSELQLYHEGSATLVRHYFADALATVTNLSGNPIITQQLTSRNTAGLTSSLEQQRTISGEFDSLTILTATGTVAAYSSNKDGFAVGTDVSQTASFISGKTASGTQIIDAHASPLKRTILTIIAPIKDARGSFQGVAVGALTLDSLAQHIKLTSSYNPDLSALLTDSQGNVLVWKDKPTASTLNVKDKEPGLAALMRQGTLPATQEYNFMQQNSLTQGSAIAFGAAGKLYLVSFYNRASYDQRLKDALESITATFANFLIRTGILMLSAMIIIGIIIRIHEKHAP